MKPTRRELIRHLMLGTGAMALGPLINLLRPLAVSAAEQTDDNYFFVEGRVRAIQGNSFLIAHGNDGIVRITHTPATDVWKGHHGMSPTAISVGDWLYARGFRLGDNLTAVVIYANIVNLSGAVLERNGNAFWLAHRQVKWWVDVPANAEILSGFTLLGYKGVTRLEPGVPVQVVGSWDEQAQKITATRVFVSARSQEPLSVTPDV